MDAQDQIVTEADIRTERPEVLEIRQLKKAFGNNVVLDDFNLTVYRDENVVVLGRSGSGKSVLIKCIIGLLRPDAGSINVLGEDMLALDHDGLDHIRMRIGFLFQSNALYDSMTVRENLEFPMRRHLKNMSTEEVNERVNEMLSNVGLAHTVDMMPSELSGGMQKRIALARTLILKPEIILYDEPTTGLDPVTGREISTLMVAMQEKYKTSSIIISHDMKCVKATADRVVVLVDGKAHAIGTYADIKQSTDTRVKQFLNNELMAKQAINNIKLGAFVIAGLAILVATLYLIGRNQSLFGNNISIRARFRNVAGLTKGNNVRFSGIQAGNVREIRIIDDTTIEVVMLVDKKFQPHIHKNALAAIGNEGLMGNKVINISTDPLPAAPIEDNDLLRSKTEAGTGEMLSTLSITNDNVAVISEDLKQTIKRLNNSAALWNLLNDTSISYNLKISLLNIRQAAVRVNTVADGLNRIVTDAHDGKGTVGALLADTAVAVNLKNAVAHINEASAEAGVLINRLDSLVQDIHGSVNNGDGTVYTLLKDTAMAIKLTNSLDNIEKGTAAFSEDMEALKHNFLTRPYFKKQEKARKKAKDKSK